MIDDGDAYDKPPLEQENKKPAPNEMDEGCFSVLFLAVGALAVGIYQYRDEIWKELKKLYDQFSGTGLIAGPVTNKVILSNEVPAAVAEGKIAKDTERLSFDEAQELPEEIIEDVQVEEDFGNNEKIPLFSHNLFVRQELPLLEAVVGEKKKLKVFLSYTSKDKVLVRQLKNRLSWHGVDVWIDEKDILGGDDWMSKIRKGISSSDAVLVCLTKNSVKKEGVLQAEIKLALELAAQKDPSIPYLIPGRLDDCEVPFDLHGKQWVDLFETSGFEKLLRGLSVRAERLGLFIPSLHINVSEGNACELAKQLFVDHVAAVLVVKKNEYAFINYDTPFSDNIQNMMLDMVKQYLEKRSGTYEDSFITRTPESNHYAYIFKDSRLDIIVGVFTHSTQAMINVKDRVSLLMEHKFGLLIDTSERHS